MHINHVVLRLAHLRHSAGDGLSNYLWIVKGLPASELLGFHYVLLALGEAVLMTPPEQTDLTTLKPPPPIARSVFNVSGVDVAPHHERIEWLLWLARLVIPGAQCLPAAIAAWWSLGDANAHVQIGVRRGEGRPFAHAWTVSNGRLLNTDSFALTNVFIPAWRTGQTRLTTTTPPSKTSFPMRPR